MNLKVIILTATDNALFNSSIPTHCHPLAGYPILTYTLDLARQISNQPPFLVVDPVLAETYRDVIGENVIITQLPDGKQGWNMNTDSIQLLKTPDTEILVLHADTPLLQLQSIQTLIECHAVGAQRITFLTNEPDTPVNIPQAERDTPFFWQSEPANFAPVIFNSDLLSSELINAICSSECAARFQQQLVPIAQQLGIKVTAQLPAEPSDLWRICTRIDYARVLAAMRTRINRCLMLSGVTIMDPSAVYIDHNVTIGRDSVIYPNTTITGTTSIGENCHIGPNTTIDQCTIGDRCHVVASVLEYAVMEHDSDIGPYSHLRKGAYVCAHAHIGNYGEMKNSTLGPGAKMGHFSYLGDTQVGEATNIGAGSITCNFDGEEKHPTHIGDHVFIGSGTLIVAPIDIGDHAATGAGSVVTHNIPENTLVYGIPAREKKQRERD